MSSAPPLAELTRAVATTLGHPVELIPNHENGRTQVLEIHAQGRPSALVLKRYLGPSRGFDQEVAAYRNWLGPLPPETTPRCTHVLDNHRAVVLQRVLGQPLHHLSTSEHELGDRYREAGAWLKILHTQTPSQPDAVPLSTALERRFRAALTRASRAPGCRCGAALHLGPTGIDL